MRPPKQPQPTNLCYDKCNEVELKGVMLDSGSLINIISLALLDAVGISKERPRGSPYEVSSIRGHRTFTIWYVKLDLTIGPIRVSHKFHVIDSHLSFAAWKAMDSPS